MEKQCRVCKLIKPLDNFHIKKTGYLGRIELCKVCKKEKDSERWKNITEEGKEKKRISFKKYYENNKEKFREYQENRPKEYWNEYKKERRLSSELIRLQESVRTRINKYLRDKRYSKNNKTFSIVGCSPQELKMYSESRFTDNMSWENYGLFGWHIDHIVPLSSSKDETELYKLFHYTNLQPLWSSDNLSKGSKII